MKWPESTSIRQVALAFVTALLVLVSLIGGFAAYQTRAVTRSLEQHSREAAQSELAAVSNACWHRRRILRTIWRIGMKPATTGDARYYTTGETSGYTKAAC